MSSENIPRHAAIVVIGSGIVGSSIVYHLAKQNWKEIVLIEKGALPSPGGSTGHASNFIFPVDHSKTMTQLTQDSVEQYKELGVFKESGGIELARLPANFKELGRRLDSAKSWGEPAELLSPHQIKELVPFVNVDLILGGFWSPTVGVVDSLEAATLMREQAEAMGSLTICANTEVVDIQIKNGCVHSVKTDRGEIRTDQIVVTCGVWSPKIGAMAGTLIPLTPAVHQMISVGPIALFEETGREIAYPILRDMSTYMYERQNGSEMEIGSYAHRPMLWEPSDIPSIAEAKLSPTEAPFTKEDFEPQMAHALELLPEILDSDKVGIRHAINGLLSVTPDGAPMLGEVPEVKGFWSSAAVWIKEGPGVGRFMAEWITHGATTIDPHEVDINRFYSSSRTKAFALRRAREGYNKIYAIVHPQEQWRSSRNVRLSPFYNRQKELGAYFFEVAGWERPHWYESNHKLLAEYGDQVTQRSDEWDSRWWSPIINAEHLAIRDRVGMVDLTAFSVFDVTGPGSLEYLQYMAVGEIDVAVGKAVYTPLLDHRGGLKSDLTITRLGSEAFRVVTGGSQWGIDGKWFRDHLADGGSVQVRDMTSALCTLGIWGPKARQFLQSVTEADLSHDRFPFATAREISLDEVRVWALRISYVGELGWELHAPMEQGQYLWDLLWERGQTFGLVPVGIGVYGTTGRMEKNFRLYGHDLTPEFNAVEAGLARTKVKAADFIGKEAYLRSLDEEPATILCTLTVDDHSTSSGETRYMLGHEPVLTKGGEPIVDCKNRRSYITSAGSGPSLGKHLLMAYLPPEFAAEGTRLKVQYFAEQYPVTVAVAGSKPLFDPENQRLKS